MAVEWKEAPQLVLDMASRIIDTHHDHLLDAKIFFIMRSEAPISNGRATYGKCKKVSAEMQVHIDADFIIWLAEDTWKSFSVKQREALLDHELSHCQWDGLNASIRGHDVEEFNHIIERYGMWWPSSDGFAMAVQAALPLSTDRKGGVGTIDFGRIAKDAASAMQADGIDAEYVAAMGRGE